MPAKYLDIDCEVRGCSGTVSFNVASDKEDQVRVRCDSCLNGHTIWTDRGHVANVKCKTKEL